MIPQRSFSRSIRIYTWMKYSTMIIRSTTRFEMSFRSFCFCFLSFFLYSFLFIFLTVVSKRTIDSTGTMVDACTECLVFVPSRERDVARASTRFSSIFFNSTIVIRILDYLSPLLQHGQPCCFSSVSINYVDCTRATNRSQRRNADRFDDR